MLANKPTTRPGSPIEWRATYVEVADEQHPSSGRQGDIVSHELAQFAKAGVVFVTSATLRRASSDKGERKVSCCGMVPVPVGEGGVEERVGRVGGSHERGQRTPYLAAAWRHRHRGLGEATCHLRYK